MTALGRVMLLLVAPRVLAAQTAGDLVGRVRESWGRGVGLAEARVEVVGTALWSLTDYKGRYRIHAVPSGYHAVRVTAVGYAEAGRDSVPAYGGTETEQDFFLPLDSMHATPRVPAPLVDPHLISARRRFSDADLAALPINRVADAAALWSGETGQSYRAGRLGSVGVLVDAIPVRSPYDASTTPLGLRVPPEFLQEAVLSPAWLGGDATRALSGVSALVTRTGGEHRRGWIRYDTDRPLSGPADLGFDRVVAGVDGPLIGRARIFGVLDRTGNVEAQAHNAPVGDPRTPAPWELTHNTGEWLDAAAKVSVSLDAAPTLQLLGVHSREDRLLFDPVFKYDSEAGPAGRLNATLLAAELRRSAQMVTGALRLSYFTRSLTQGELTGPAHYRFWGLGGPYDIRGLDLARARDTVAAQVAVPGFSEPTYSDRTPWGVPAFFLGGGSRGTLLWSQYREARLDVSVTAAPSARFTVSGDAAVALGHLRAFQRVLAFLPVGDSVPAPTTANAAPISVTVGVQLQGRIRGAVLAGGLQIEGLAPHDGAARGLRIAMSPAVGLTLPVSGLTLYANAARASQFPDLQFLSNIAFDDTLAGGRFRWGNADLHYESVGWGELGFRARPWTHGSIRLGVFGNQFDDLAASAAAPFADSSRIANGDDMSVTGIEASLEKGFGDEARVTATYELESATYRSANGLRLPVGDTSITADLQRLIVVARARLPGAVQTTGVMQYRSGLPFANVSAVRLPAQISIDALLKRAFRIGARTAQVYLDVRNVLDRRNVVALRRDTGTPAPDSAAIEAMAQAAYAANSDPIPYESPRYRAYADLDGNGVVEGPGELLPMYRRAAEDFTHPLTAYGSPRSVRLGLSLAF